MVAHLNVRKIETKNKKKDERVTLVAEHAMDPVILKPPTKAVTPSSSISTVVINAGEIGTLDTNFVALTWKMNKKHLQTLTSIARGRFATHLINKVTDRKKNGSRHPTWVFFVTNLPHFCAFFVQMKLVKTPEDWMVHDPNIPVLVDLHAKLLDAKQMTQQGVYLFWCPKTKAWVRSGKVCGGETRNFAARYDEHSKSAQKTMKTSTFYQTYPNDSTSNPKRIAHFSTLGYYCAIIIDDIRAGLWDRIKWTADSRDEKEKFLDLVYACELLFWSS